MADTWWPTGPLGEREVGGDLAVVEALRDEREHFKLPCGEPERVLSR
jgi:hypothetical protein